MRSTHLVKCMMDSDRDNLPRCWKRPRQRDRGQACLFADPRDVGLASLSVSEDEIRRWHEAGWISEQAVTGELLHDNLVEEIEFVRDIARSGLSDGQISSLLRNLGHDEFSYNGHEVAYSFRYGWVQVAEPERPDFAEPERPDFIEFISECADDEDAVSLEELLRAEEILTEAIAARQPDGDEKE